MQASLEQGKVVTLDKVNTIADGTAVKTPGSIIFPYIQQNIDEIITVGDEELVTAFLDMVGKPQDGGGKFRTAYRCGAQAPEREE